LEKQQNEGDQDMSIKPPLTDLPIRIAESGFYRGFTKDVTITAKILVGALILWAVAFPEQAGSGVGRDELPSSSPRSTSGMST
jgi:hypothetical protein